MALPYERQIRNLLQELVHYQMVAARCRREKAPYTDALCVTCSEIERAVHALERKQQLVLAQWKKTTQQDRSRVIRPVADGVEQMAVLAEQKGCKAVGEYLESCISEEILELLDQPGISG